MHLYRLDSEQENIVERIRKIAEQSIAPHAENVDRQGAFPQEAVDSLAEAGFLGLTVPKEFGGMGQDLRAACAVLDELARHCGSTAMVYMMHLSGIACYLNAPEKTADYLRAAASGRHLSTLAWSERGSRSQFWAPVSQASRIAAELAADADGNLIPDPASRPVMIHSEKSFVTSAGHADGYVLSTRWCEGTSPLQSMLYLILKDDPGVEVAGRWDSLGLRGNASAPMTFRNINIGPERALSEEGKGLDVMLGRVLPVFQLASASVAVGLAEAAVRVTQSHLNQARFEHNNSKLADLPNLRAALARMRIETDRSRSHLVSVIDALEQPSPSTQLLVLEIKASASEAAVQVTDLGMRACGGAAFNKHFGLERIFRDARAAVVMAPTTDHAYEFIGKALCGMEVLA